MKIAVIGGTGRIGSRIVTALAADGHDATPHARSTGVDLVTGEGLARALADVDVVVDTTQSPTADDASTGFFRTATGNLLTAAAQAGVRHVVLLSIVGVDRAPGVAYYRAKVAQEDLFTAGAVPWSIVRATQFFEYLDEIMSWTTDGDIIRLPSTLLQPIAAGDAAVAVADVAVGAPLHGVRNVAGPDVLPLDELGRITVAARGDGRIVKNDDTAGPFAAVPGDTLTVTDGAYIGPTRYIDWLAV